MENASRQTPSAGRGDATASLRRLLANGRLTAIPKRPADQRLIAAMAAARFEADETFLEAEVNERLAQWLESISEPFGIDHVTLRRMLVDFRYLARTRSGSVYRVNQEQAAELEAVRGLEPTHVLDAVRNERQVRKQQQRAAG